MAQEKFELIVTVINSGYSEDVMKCAKEAGARGGTVLRARGTGNSEIAEMFGITIQPEKEFILILAPTADKEKIMKAIAKGAGLLSESKGIVFSVPASDAIGIYGADVQQEESNAKE